MAIAASPAALRRVAVTGVGLVTPFGLGLDTTARRLAAGERAPRQAVPGTPRLATVAAPELELRSRCRVPKALKLADRRTRLAIAASLLAVEDAGLGGVEDRDEWAVVLGCSGSDIQAAEVGRALAVDPRPLEPDDAADFGARILARLNPLWLLIHLPNMVGAHVGIQLASTGPNHTLTGDGLAGLQAIGEAWLAVAAGEREVAVAGGADSPCDPFDLGCLASDPRLVDRDDGEPLALAEGAAVLVLEPLTSARARGATIRAEILATASGAPLDGDVGANIERVVATALAMAGLAVPDLAVVAPATGDGHPLAGAEAAALARLGLARSLRPADAFGYALAAAGPIGAALLAAVLAGPGDTAAIPPSRYGLALALGAVGQCAALVVASPGCPEMQEIPS